MYKYCLFDLDGTLTDPKEGICKSVAHALKHFDIDEPNLDKLEPFIGPPLMDSFKEFYNFNEEDSKKAVALYRERFGKLGLYENVLYDGITDMLDQLYVNKVKLVIASSKPTVFIKKILKHFKIDMYFDIVMGSELDGTRARKDEVIEAALLALYQKENPSVHSLDECKDMIKNTVMIGDRRFDIEGATFFGLDSIGVSYGYGSKDELMSAGATYIVDTVSQLLTLLKDKTGVANTTVAPNGISSDPSVHTLRYAIYTIVPLAIYYLVDAITLVVGARILKHFQSTGEIKATANILYTQLHCVALVIIGLLMYILYHNRHQIPARYSKRLLVTPICGTFLALGINLIFGYANAILNFSDELTSRASYDTALPIALATIWYVILAPLVEELIFRWVIFSRVKAMVGRRLGIIISAAFFGVYHGNLLQGAYAFIMGILLALCVEWTGSIYASIIFHVFANATIYYVAYLPENIKPYAGSLGSCLIMLFIASLLMRYLYKTREVQ